MSVERRMRAVLAAVLCLWVSAGVAAQDDAPMIRPELLRQVAPSVWIIPDEGRPMVPNVGFVVGQTGILVVDTGLGARNGAIVAGVARKLAPNLRIYLVTTHIHPEHDMGASGFPRGARMLDGSTLLRATTQEQDIAEFGCSVCKAFSDRSPAAAELLKGATYREADISFENDRTLDLGGVRAYIFAAGPNHTRGDTAVWVETEQVLFSGDIAMKPQPSLGSPYSSVGHWLSTLDSLAQLRPRVIVPSHGPTGGPELIAGYKAYFTEIQERAAAEKKAGRTPDDAVKAVTDAMTERYPDRNRLAGAIRAAFKEAP
jgi:glyoxylase-like metal-dependent hydrolase (beta-lactamase superfamily II)